ncbi:MAG: DEAD/DEAH box helicase [Staphylothermus sp.]|nr:DEAD/DEAH box helicase [Staphylothermus sp.]
MSVFSKEILSRLGYEYLYRVKPGKEPEYVEYRFRDIIEELGSIELGSKRLYKHQYDGLMALRNDFNLIIRSGTGSGKTEVWVLYVMERIREQGSFRALVLYPTLALANDQIKRINKYLGLINDKPLQLDSVKRQELVREVGRSGLRDLVAKSNVIVSNPAFILHDLKKLLIHPTQALLYSFYKDIDLIVVDEIDFYGPRSIALLLAMLNVLSKISDKKPQIAVLTATLSNPEDLGDYLKKITGREYVVVEGKPFSIENHLYIILGKNLKIIWEILRKKRGVVENIQEEPVRKELLRAINSYDYFSKNLHRIISIAHSYDIDLPLPTIDAAEIIKEYLNDRYVTIVFTYSISQAEELVRTIKYRYGEETPIATHHHLVPKKKREEIEEKTRRGEIKVIVSPRTLSQGIDIGLVKRIVHLGLPDDVREYYQREGRKGRRKELGFSETIIIPHSRWDRELFSKGFEVFEKWLDLGIEKTLINPDNLYIHLFTGIAKLLSPWYREELSSLEKEALRRTGVLREDGINTNLLKWIFERMNFYEFAPPYGIKRYLIKNNEKIPLEPIGHCDLVEKFQPGNIDYSEEAIVTHIETGRSTRHVRAVIEKPIREISFYEDDAFAVALEEYRYIKMNWGEKPSILRDILAGRLSSEELCVVYTPWNGFGKYRKIPDRCIWRLRSEKPRVMVRGDKAIVYYDRRQIYVPKPTAGEYRDYTYGYTYSVNPDENSELMRLGLAMLMILLRRKYGIAFETIMYDVIKIGEYKYFSLHEPESAGIIDEIDWLDVRKKVEEYSFDDLDLILLSEIDDISYSILISYDFDWETVRQEMLRLVNYILARERIKVLLKDVELTIPKPSPGLKLLSISIMTEIIGEETEMPQLLVGINVYDGGEHVGDVALYPPIPYIKPPREILGIEERILEKIMYEEYKVIVPNKDTFLKQLKSANLRYLSMIIEKTPENLLEIDTFKPKTLSQNISYEELVYTAFPDMRRIEPARIREALSKINQSKRISKKEKEIILEYLRNQSILTYYAYLLISELKKKA